MNMVYFLYVSMSVVREATRILLLV